MCTCDLKEYLRFEAEFIQDELEQMEVFRSQETVAATRNKRMEAKMVWEEQGRAIPEGVSFPN